MAPKDDLPVRTFASRSAWARWLQTNHGRAAGIWVQIAKKGSDHTSVTYAEALEVALCYGWIDGVKAALDDAHWLQRFTPRRPRSKWSKINCVKATELIERGAMKPAGQREVDRAKADGRWDAAYDSQRTAAVPDDFRAALLAHPGAAEFFETLSSTNRYTVLFRIHDAKRPDTRARRIAQFAEMMARGEKIYP